jgi:hypothetical protein
MQAPSFLQATPLSLAAAVAILQGFGRIIMKPESYL